MPSNCSGLKGLTTQAVSSLYDSLLPGGFVFLGHSESVGRISAAFEPVILANNLMYRRPIPCPAPVARQGTTR